MPPTTGIPIFHAVVLGVVQGLTEFIPVSSSGHLILVPWLFGWNDFANNADAKKTFDVALHLGTFVGAAGYFLPDLRRLAKAGARSIRRRSVGDFDERQAWLLLLSAIPGALTGAALESVIEEYLSKEGLIAANLIVFGLVLAIADRVAARRSEKDFATPSAAAMGIAQALALAPGVSRSGVTISAARGLGFDRTSAARLSFLMSLPIIAGAAFYKGAKVLLGGGLPPGTEQAFVAGMVTSAITGALAIGIVLRHVKNGSFTPYVAYRLGLGVLVLVLLATGLR
ncbi:MAG: undecaprenyl-diphosphate phosphatase, partial [Acidimicrobiales bacterium]